MLLSKHNKLPLIKKILLSEYFSKLRYNSFGNETQDKINKTRNLLQTFVLMHTKLSSYINKNKRYFFNKLQLQSDKIIENKLFNLVLLRKEFGGSDKNKLLFFFWRWGRNTMLFHKYKKGLINLMNLFHKKKFFYCQEFLNRMIIKYLKGYQIIIQHDDFVSLIHSGFDDSFIVVLREINDLHIRKVTTLKKE